MEKLQDIILGNDKMKVKLDMYTQKARDGAVSALKQQMGCELGKESILQGLQGSFRNLQVD